MLDALAKLWDLDKLPARVPALVFAVSAFFMWMPETWATAIRATKLRDEYGHWLAVFFVGAGATIVFQLGAWAIIRARRSLEARRKLKIAVQVVKTLDEHEQAVIREFEVQKKNVILLPLDDPIGSGRLNNGSSG